MKVLYDAVVYGKTPTLGDFTFVALDLLDIVPLAWGSATIIKTLLNKA